MSEQPKQRFTHGVTCPVCDGSGDDPRGNGTRCFGFISGNWIHCTREENSPGCTYHPESSTYSHRLKGPCKCGFEHKPADPNPNGEASGKARFGEIDGVYKYHDETGKVVFETVRFKNPKDFRQRQPNPRKGEKWSLDGIETVLYHLPLLLTADPDQPVWICEGEKDVENLGAKGRLTTCNPMGAGKWQDRYSETLRGRHCLIIPHNDKAGRDHAQQVAQSLHGKAASIKVVELPGLPEKGDVSDFLSAGGTVEQLDDLGAKTKVWTPPVGNAWEGDPPETEKTGDSTASPRVQGTEGKPKSKKAGKQKQPDSQATVLLSFASSAKFFHAPDQRCFARIAVENHTETHEIRSTGFRRWMIRTFYLKTKKSPSAEAIQTAVATLEAMATFDGPEEPVFVRVAPGPDGSIFIDLGNPTWNAVKVSADDWEVVADPPGRFIRPKGLRPLPTPERGGSLELLRKHLTVGESDWRLFISWLTQALRPTGPYPVLMLAGEQGSSKSTTARIARMHIDPHVTMLRSEPRENRDLMIGACNGWMIALDNVSHLADWLSDGLCRVATGGGFATRSLYSDSEETYLDATRPIVIASIEDVVRRGDLADRCLTLTLAPIPESKRRTEADVWSDVEADSPRIMGAILDAVAGGLRNLPTVQLSKLPRMADFAKWGEAVCRGLGNQPDDFLRAYTDNRKQANESVLEDSPVAHFVKNLASAGKWAGTSRELLDSLAGLAGEKTVKSKRWPKSPRGLSGILRRLAPSLRMVGIAVEFTLEGHTRTRTITIESASPENDCTQPSAPSAPSASVCETSVLPGETANASADGRNLEPSALRPQPSAPSAPSPEKQAMADDAGDADGRKRPFSGDPFGKVRERFEL